MSMMKLSAQTPAPASPVRMAMARPVPPANRRIADEAGRQTHQVRQRHADHAARSRRKPTHRRLRIKAPVVLINAMPPSAASSISFQRPTGTSAQSRAAMISATGRNRKDGEAEQGITDIGVPGARRAQPVLGRPPPEAVFSEGSPE